MQTALRLAGPRQPQKSTVRQPPRRRRGGLLPELGRALHFAPPCLGRPLVPWSSKVRKRGHDRCHACSSCRHNERRRRSLTAPSPSTCVGRQPCSSVIDNAHKEVTQAVRACGCFCGGGGGFCVRSRARACGPGATCSSSHLKRVHQCAPSSTGLTSRSP